MDSDEKENSKRTLREQSRWLQLLRFALIPAQTIINVLRRCNARLIYNVVSAICTIFHFNGKNKKQRKRIYRRDFDLATQELLKNMDCFVNLDRSVTEQAKFILYFSDPSSARISLLDSFATGSAVGGSFLAKWFHPDDLKHEIEFDMQHKLKLAFRVDPKLIKPVRGKPENVHILEDVETFIVKQMNKNRVGDVVNPQHYNAGNVKDILGKKHEDYVLPSAMNKPHDVFEQSHSASNLTLTTKIRVDYKNGASLHTSLDEVLVLRVPWPKIASDFATRSSRKHLFKKTHWPAFEQKRKLMKNGCDLAPKSSPGGDTSSEWRWSFALEEKQLTEWLTESQQRTYSLVKIMFYRHVIPLDNDNIRSYWVKTTMFWLAEEYPSTDEIWCDENIIESARLFFNEFLEMIHVWNLPHYFIPSSSLLPDTDREKLQMKMIDIVTRIVQNPERFVPSSGDFEQVYAAIKGPQQILNDFKDMMDDVRLLVDTVFCFSWGQGHQGSAVDVSCNASSDHYRILEQAQNIFTKWLFKNSVRSYFFSKILRYRHVIAYESGEDMSYQDRPAMFSLKKEYHSFHDKKLVPDVQDFHEKFLRLVENWEDYFVPSSLLLQGCEPSTLQAMQDKVGSIIRRLEMKGT